MVREEVHKPAGQLSDFSDLNEEDSTFVQENGELDTTWKGTRHSAKVAIKVHAWISVSAGELLKYNVNAEEFGDCRAFGVDHGSRWCLVLLDRNTTLRACGVALRTLEAASFILFQVNAIRYSPPSCVVIADGADRTLREVLPACSAPSWMSGPGSEPHTAQHEPTRTLCGHSADEGRLWRKQARTPNA